MSADPTEEDYLLQLVESKLLEVDELHNGDFFGDDCVIVKTQMKHSLVTAMPTEILTLDAHDFLQMNKEVHNHCLLL